VAALRGQSRVRINHVLLRRPAVEGAVSCRSLVERDHRHINGLGDLDLAIENGLVLRAVGDTMIIAPPLIITHEQIDELITKAISTLDATAAAVQRI
jgi:adenosylmethionine-8-amino-7-oxononanoate aminotransferase